MTNTVTTLLVQDLNNDGDLWIECKLCGGCGYQSKGVLRHKRGCTSTAQYTPGTIVLGSAVVAESPLKAFGAEVMRTGMTGGRDADVLRAVREGYLSESDAMNTDD